MSNPTDTSTSPTTPGTTTAATTAAVPAGDPRRALFAAFAAAEPVLASAQHADRNLPTPCPDYTVGDLLAHLNSVGNRIAAMGRGQAASAVPDLPAPADGHYDAAWAAHHQDVIAAWSGLGTDSEIVVPWRTMTAVEAAAIYVAEVVVHTWDLAVATGTPFTVADEVAEAGIAGLEAEAPPAVRSEIFEAVRQQLPDDFAWSDPFGAAVEAPQDASPLDRLVAISGRSPRWPGA